MPAKPLPTFSNLDRYTDSLHPADSVSAYGRHDGELVLPEDDAARLPRGLSGEHGTAGNRGANSRPVPDMPIQFLSIPTKVADAPNLPQTWNSGDKGQFWLSQDSYPTSKTGTVPVASGTLPRDRRKGQ